MRRLVRPAAALALASALACAGLPAAAEGPAYDPLVLESCLTATPAGAADRCIGLGAARCQAGPDGSTTVGMTDCLSHELADWDRRLNAAYGTLSAEAKAADLDLADVGSSAPPAAPALVQAQRRWIDYRDAACAYVAATWQGGSGTGPAGADCAMRLTAVQTLWLLAQVRSDDPGAVR